ncbi:hypothetical protein F751_0342 [Auxenochlorella protothecoides]|uniref:Uncharacterized protein n=1 Tax=Auxenochlorella protothecoides TaxID=3075 RepID=A0A087SB80_AUXPR|nr:hypothetical protein F751_0342 [Auxenochlorella protothecoides]KFM22984.1 hypothetical protein F751_0342 [Auxenochlorella protothecoides]RMZ57157.1 hypothetical protein APUTEX25_003991 [Auxenochlorella protothecoides]|eukprot:RMZ57157.1 hypothetical protein APUTEX25_003991 [Auxenochlorella protothecoides]
MVEQPTSIDEWATASLATARPVQTPEVRSWPGGAWQIWPGVLGSHHRACALTPMYPHPMEQMYAWSESDSEEGLLGVDAGCTFEGAVSPGFTTEDEEAELARQAARRGPPAMPSICMDADWLYDLGRTVHVPDDVDANEELQQGPEEDEPVSWERVEAGPLEARRAAPFKNVLPPIQHLGHEES